MKYSTTPALRSSGKRWVRWIQLVAALVLALSHLSCTARLGEENNSSLAKCASGISCAGSCVDSLSDDSNCGTCGSVCGLGQFCNQGACEAFCVAGQASCGDACVGTLSDAANCGGCGLICPPGEFCDSGSCSATCSGGLCDGPTGGQCVHLSDDPSHCGACNSACPGGLSCENGQCVAGCAPGRTACGGVCADVANSNVHCGVCGNACPAGQECVGGKCGGEPCEGGVCACTEGTVDCSGACVDTQLNLFHCGGCGLQCVGGQECTMGVCACPGGGLLCDNLCVDPEADNQNCGTCGNACSGSRTCEEGACSCVEGLTECGEICADTQVSPQNCGECGNACAGYESCVEGTCIFDDDSCGGGPTAISISRVALYQGVEVDLFKEGQWVAPESRSSPVIAGRRAMVRVFVNPQAGFAQSEISARVFVDNGGDVAAFFSKKSVSGASVQGNLNSTFNINVPGEMLAADTLIWVELASCGSPGTGEPGQTRVPAEGTTPLSARTTGKVRVAFIPVEHGGRVPDVTANSLAAYAEEVYRMYPTHEFEVVDIEALLGMSAQLPSGQGSSIDLGSLLDAVTTFRKGHLDEGKITPDIYYYGLVDPASSFNAYCQGGCTTGIGWVPGATGNFSERNRAAVGIGFGTRGAGTFAHELGHNMGRNHAPCGGAGGPDQEFPHEGAKIGSWGYDLDAGTLRNPSEYVDFMGYCSPQWVSDYTYNALVSRIATVNGASSNFEAGRGASATWWQRALMTDSQNFWLSPEHGAPSAEDEMVPGAVYDASGAVIDEFAIHRIDMSEGGGYVLYVPPARPGWYAIGQVGEWAIVY